MISPTTCQKWVPPDLVDMIVPLEAEIAGALGSPSALWLIGQGAGFYRMPDGTGRLALEKPPGGIPVLLRVRDLLPLVPEAA